MNVPLTVSSGNLRVSAVIFGGEFRIRDFFWLSSQPNPWRLQRPKLLCITLASDQLILPSCLLTLASLTVALGKQIYSRLKTGSVFGPYSRSQFPATLQEYSPVRHPRQSLKCGPNGE